MKWAKTQYDWCYTDGDWSAFVETTPFDNSLAWDVFYNSSRIVGGSVTFDDYQPERRAKKYAARALKREIRRAWKPDRRWKKYPAYDRWQLRDSGLIVEVFESQELYSVDVYLAADDTYTYWLGYKALADAQYEAERRLRRIKEALG